MGSDLDNAPFASVNAGGAAIGRDVEMMQALARDAGVSLEWKRLPFDQLLSSLREGELDIVCATMGITDERKLTVAFTDPYFETSISVVLRAGFGQGASLVERLSGKAVHAGVGTTSELAVRNALPDATLYRGTKEVDTSLELLMDGHVDALVMDEPAARKLVAASGGLVELADERLAEENYALVISRDAKTLRQRLNKSLGKLASRGEWRALNERFALQPRTGSR